MSEHSATHPTSLHPARSATSANPPLPAKGCGCGSGCTCGCQSGGPCSCGGHCGK